MLSLEQYRALHETSAIVAWPARGRIRLTGADRRTYLQGILTNDIAALQPGTGCYAAMLTPQGRMIADMRVLELGAEILIDLDADLASSIAERLAQFVFTEDVTVTDVTGTLGQIGVYGPGAAASLEHAGGPRAQALDDMSLFASVAASFGGHPATIVRSDDAGVPGFDVFVAADALDDLRRLLSAAGAVQVDADAVEVTRIESGRPRFHVDMDEETIPLEAGIEDRAISLTKGCYVGQEIIIRVLHRGHGRVAKRLVGLLFDPAARVPEHGAAIVSGDREIGRITSAAQSPALGRPIALGYVHRDSVEPGTGVTIRGTPDLAATVAALPFVRTGTIPSRAAVR